MRRLFDIDGLATVDDDGVLALGGLACTLLGQSRSATEILDGDVRDWRLSTEERPLDGVESIE